MVDVIELTKSITLYKVGLVNYYVVKGEEVVIFEAGLSCSAEKLLEELDVEPDYVIVPHGHFDHVGGVAVFKEVYPDVKIAAHPAVAELAGKEKVVNSWRTDDAELCKNYYKKEGVGELNVGIDIEVTEGSQVGDLEIMETPGHTRDCISGYLRRENAVFVNDSLGFAFSSGGILPMFFYNFEDYVKSIKRVQGLKPYILGLSHNTYFTGRACDDFISESLSETIQLYNRLKRGDISDEELVSLVFRDEIRYYPEMTMKATAKLLKKRVMESAMEF